MMLMGISMPVRWYLVLAIPLRRVRCKLILVWELLIAESVNSVQMVLNYYTAPIWAAPEMNLHTASWCMKMMNFIFLAPHPLPIFRFLREPTNQHTKVALQQPRQGMHTKTEVIFL